MTDITFNNVYGAAEVGQIVEKFNFSKVISTSNLFFTQFPLVTRFQIDLHGGSQKPGLVIDLAPIYGMLDKKSLQSLDDDTKILIAFATKRLHSIPKGSRNLDSMTVAFLESNLMQLATEPEYKSDIFVDREPHLSFYDTGHMKVVPS